jgi:uncharacterized protein YfbU (UPF0304 family)
VELSVSIFSDQGITPISKKRKFQKISKGKSGGYVFDTHLPTTSIYLPMVKKWRQFGRKQVLSKDEVLDILGIVKKDPSGLN